MMEKAIDLATATHSTLAETQRVLLDAKSQLAALQANMPGMVAEVVRQSVQPLYGANGAQRDDLGIVKQQSERALVVNTDIADSMKALIWIWAVIAVVAVIMAGRSFL